MRRPQRGQASTEAALVAALLAGAGLVAVDGVAARLRAVPPPSATAQAPVGATDGLPVLDGLPAERAARIVAVAEHLLAAGIRETGANDGPLVRVLTDGRAEAWCADFVSYVLRAAGRPFTGGASGGWRIAAAAGVRDWFAARGRYAPRAGARPAAGDVVYFAHGHVGIVVAERGGILETIEGNAGDAVRRRHYPGWRSIADIDGFGRP